MKEENLHDALLRVDFTRSLLGHAAEQYIDYLAADGPAYMAEASLGTMRSLREALAAAEARVAELVSFDRAAA